MCSSSTHNDAPQKTESENEEEAGILGVGVETVALHAVGVLHQHCRFCLAHQPPTRTTAAFKTNITLGVWSCLRTGSPLHPAAYVARPPAHSVGLSGRASQRRVSAGQGPPATACRPDDFDGDAALQNKNFVEIFSAVRLAQKMPVGACIPVGMQL